MPAGALAILLLLGLTGCATFQTAAPTGGTALPSTVPAASPPAASPTPPPGPALACIGVAEDACRVVADQILVAVSSAPGAPFAVEIVAHGCENPPCPQTMSNGGYAIVEYADGREPIRASVEGPPEGPTILPEDVGWSGLHEPSSERVLGAGPFPIEIGHCGLLWKVDFDGSFWLPVGQVDGDAPVLSTAERGAIRLLAQNRAEYAGADGFSASLIRLPGPKHVFLCR